MNPSRLHPVLATTCFIAAMIAWLGTSCVTAACTVPPPDMVGWWRAEGDAGDNAGFNTGNLSGNAWFEPGRVGLGFAFDGNGDAILLGNPPALQLQDFTIEAWVKRKSVIAVSLVTPDAELFCYGLGGYGLGMWSNGRLFLTKAGVDNIATTTGITDTNFHHVAVTKVGTAVTFYIDGAPHPMPPYKSIFEFSTPVAIGARGDDLNNSFLGIIDELAVYSRALAPIEITNIYLAGAAGKCRAVTLPVIVDHPQPQFGYVGEQVVFAALAGGDDLFYQWRYNGEDIQEANATTLILSNVNVDAAGDYSLQVSNSAGVVESSSALLTVSTPPACAPLLAGAVSWWRADQNLFDTVGINDGLFAGNAAYVPGRVGFSFSFDGDRDAVRLGNPASLQLQNFTIECWVRRYSATASSLVSPDAELFCYGANGYGFGMWNDGRLFLTKVQVNNLPSSIAVTDTNYHHVAVTKSGSQVIFYIDGVAEVAPAYASVFTFTTPVAIGARGDNTNNSFYGQIDELTVYNRALSQSEVQSIYTAAVSGKCPPSDPPQFVTHPTNVTVTAGANAILAAGAVGVRPIYYQWRKAGSPVTGATNSTLLLTNVQPPHAGIYSVVATNANGNAVSSNAQLRVSVITATGNGQPLTNSLHSFNTSVSIQLQNAYPGGLIFYTLDGTPPTFASLQYTDPLAITSNVVLRALGYSADFFYSGELEPITILLPPSYALFLGTGGGGTVAADPATGPHLSNTVVTLSATPTTGWQFLQWLGDVSGNSAVTNVPMDRTKHVQAVFGTTLATTAAGGGTVVLNPPGGIYPYGSIIQIAGVPNPGNQFALWGNAASGNVNPLRFTLTNANPTVSSLFAAVGSGQEAVTVVPVGWGQVSVSPRANTYATGSSVTITATPEPGQAFVEWSGDASGAQNPLTVNLNQDRLIYANFTVQPRLTGEWLNMVGVRLTLWGNPPGSYLFEASTNLTAWSVLSTTPSTNLYGTIQVTDSAATNQPHRFYRARETGN